MTAAEASNPRRSIPKAIKRVYFRVLIFYIGGVFIIGLLVPSNNPSLNSTSAQASTSPFATAFKEAGIQVLPLVRYGSERPVLFKSPMLLIDHQCCHCNLCVVC
jgi:amino acid transporter